MALIEEQFVVIVSLILGQRFISPTLTSFYFMMTLYIPDFFLNI